MAMCARCTARARISEIVTCLWHVMHRKPKLLNTLICIARRRMYIFGGTTKICTETTEGVWPLLVDCTCCMATTYGSSKCYLHIKPIVIAFHINIVPLRQVCCFRTDSVGVAFAAPFFVVSLLKKSVEVYSLYNIFPAPLARVRNIVSAAGGGQ